MEDIFYLLIKIVVWVGFGIYLLCQWYYHFMKAQLKVEALINLADKNNGNEKIEKPIKKNVENKKASQNLYDTMNKSISDAFDKNKYVFLVLDYKVNCHLKDAETEYQKNIKDFSNMFTEVLDEFKDKDRELYSILAEMIPTKKSDFNFMMDVKIEESEEKQKDIQELKNIIKDSHNELFKILKQCVVDQRLNVKKWEASLKKFFKSKMNCKVDPFLATKYMLNEHVQTARSLKILEKNFDLIYVPYVLDKTHKRKALSYVKDEEEKNMLLQMKDEEFEDIFNSNLNDQMKKYTTSQIKNIQDEIEKHYEVLKTKFEDSFSQDDYGTKHFDFEKWSNEIQYCIDKVFDEDVDLFLVQKIFMDLYTKE